MNKSLSKRSQASLPLQLAIVSTKYFAWCFFTLTVCCMIYKAVKWPYPRSILAWECSALSFLAIIEAVQVSLGTRGNLTQSSSLLMIFTSINLMCIAAHAYLARYQTYVLRVDQVINILALIPLCTSTLFAFVSSIVFMRKRFV